MKILLVNPRNPLNAGRDLYTSEVFSFLHNFRAGEKKVNFALPLALPTLASLTPPQFSVEIVDEMVEPIQFHKEYDLVGITAMTFKANRAYQIAGEFKKRGIPVIMGGIHTTVCPEEVAKHVDSVVIGEADELWPLILKDFETGTLLPRYTAQKAPDISMIPPPRYDLISRNSYLAFPIQTSRGCPNSCKFCTVTMFNGKTVRKKTLEQVTQEVEHLLKVTGLPITLLDRDDNKKRKRTSPSIFFTDDNFAIDRKHALSLCRALKEYQKRKNILLLWFTQVNYQAGFDDELLMAMRAAGCQLLFIGFESLEEESLRSMKKTMNSPNLYAACIRNIKRHGLEVCFSTILGGEFDTPEVGEKIADFIEKNDVFFVLPNILTPYPGTALGLEMEKNNKILFTNHDYFNVRNVVFKHNRMSARQLQLAYTELCERVFTLEKALKRAKASTRYPKRYIIPIPQRMVVWFFFSLNAIFLAIYGKIPLKVLLKLFLAIPFFIKEGSSMSFTFLGMSMDYDDFARSEKERFPQSPAATLLM